MIEIVFEICYFLSWGNWLLKCLGADGKWVQFILAILFIGFEVFIVESCEYQRDAVDTTTFVILTSAEAF